jgi:abequosyltransferase
MVGAPVFDIFSADRMTQLLLTIAVPTFNRATCLSVLLRTLQTELAGFEGVVEVIVFDNASSDDTPFVISAFKAAWPTVRIVRNAENIGADRNISQCVIGARSKYVWIMGDDDMAKAGVVCQLIEILRREAPDMIYMRSEWIDKIIESSQGERVGNLNYEVMEKAYFASCVHVWFTFISGVVINKQLLLQKAGESVVQRYIGTNFVQLGWVLNVLKFGSRFVYIRDRCMLATSNNSGGYAVITTFGSNYPRVVSDVFGSGSPLSTILIRRNLVCYLPKLMWHVRFASVRKFGAEDPWRALQKELGGHLSYWLLLIPIGRFPKYLAWPFFQASRVLTGLVRAYDFLVRS